MSRAGLVSLTERQEKIAECIADGLSYRAIARVLGISAFTVRKHVIAIVKKLPSDRAAEHLTPYRRVVNWRHGHN